MPAASLNYYRIICELLLYYLNDADVIVMIIMMMIKIDWIGLLSKVNSSDLLFLGDDSVTGYFRTKIKKVNYAKGSSYVKRVEL